MTSGSIADGGRFRACYGKVAQVLLSICGLLICTCHGLMFGWPCHYFARTFRDPDPPIDIPFTVAPLLAGTMMMGNILGTILSYFSRPNAKYAMVVGAASMTLGWGMLWQSRNINWFFASRAFIGLGLGLTTFNLRSYIEDICDTNFSEILTKCHFMFIYFGVFLSTVIGHFDISIPSYGLYVATCTLTIMCLCIIIPQTPLELYRFGDVKLARWLRNFLNSNKILEEDLPILNKRSKDSNDCTIMWTDLLVKSELRLKFFVLFVACFFQQFTGMPATIVFGEFIYEQFGVPNPSLITIFYTIILFTVYSFSVHLINNNKKTFMMISSASVCVTFLVLIILFHFNVTSKYPVAVVLCMYLYVVFHTFGLGCLTSQVCIEIFPPCYKRIVRHFIVIFNAMWSILVGKTFQVLYSQFHLYGPFTMYTILSGVAVVFIWLCINIYENKNSGAVQNKTVQSGIS